MLNPIWHFCFIQLVICATESIQPRSLQFLFPLVAYSLAHLYMPLSTSSLLFVVLYLVFRSPISPSLVQSPCSRVIICNPFGALFNFHTFHVKSHEYCASCVRRLMGFAPSMSLRTLVKGCSRQQLFHSLKKKYIFNWALITSVCCLQKDNVRIKNSTKLSSLLFGISVVRV